jgi:hypothetical protein
VIRKAKAKARDENKVKLTLTVTPTARHLLAEMAELFDLSLSELMERIARKEIGIDLDRQLLGES